VDGPTPLFLARPNPVGHTAGMSERDMSEVERFLADKGHLEAAAKTFLLEWFGRCPDYHRDCIVCKRWAALNALLEDPFIENEG